ncbi:MAG: response regulator transcription factor [Oscillospiraceae bacterium]|nr:response regulator transcription factor [Oscillospiraceae bacterium]
MRILIAEDEVGLARGLKYLLEKNNFTVDTVHNGNDAIDFFHASSYDAVVLDIMMPGRDGLSVLSELRREGETVPIMMLSAKSEVEDRVAGLESGADDYLPKPFATQEFLARVKALARRNSGYTDTVLTFGNTSLNSSRYELSCGDKTVRLNNKEFQILELFFRYPQHVLSTDYIMDKLWNLDSDVGTEVVWTYISTVRRKMKTMQSDVEIRTIRGAGYSLEKEPC